MIARDPDFHVTSRPSSTMIWLVRLFISYSRRDAAFVERLRPALEADGNDVWVDTEDIR
jgi:hypothetical protein